MARRLGRYRNLTTVANTVATALGRPSRSLGLGTATLGNLGRAMSDESAAEVLSAAWVAGIRHFDTAPHYGLGLAERRLGRFLGDAPRDEFIVSTKVGRLLVPNPDFGGGNDEQFVVPNDLMRVFDPSVAGVRRSLEESLDRAVFPIRTV